MGKQNVAAAALLTDSGSVVCPAHKVWRAQVTPPWLPRTSVRACQLLLTVPRQLALLETAYLGMVPFPLRAVCSG